MKHYGDFGLVEYEGRLYLIKRGENANKVFSIPLTSQIIAELSSFDYSNH
jgi:hypothetical protein